MENGNVRFSGVAETGWGTQKNTGSLPVRTETGHCDLLTDPNPGVLPFVLLEYFSFA